MSEYKKGDIVKGNITGIEKYGIFVSLDNYYNGLIHISEISNDFVSNVNDYGKVGDSIYSKILEIDNDSNRLKLSIRGINYKKKIVIIKKSIKPVGKGFEVLCSKLDEWIQNKLEEIKQK
jgi:general stress protein 13